ncbi:MAG: hypothetical protein IMZ66_04280 [Planctomycetes bacterium]|nr:hypothetical protein [Planctomycetota bacterium]
MNTILRMGLVMGAAALVAAGCVETADRPAADVPADAVSDLVLPTGKAATVITEKDFVTRWLVLGPIRFKESDFKEEEQQDAADKAFVADEAGLDGTQPAPEGATWQAKAFAGEGQAGEVDLDALYEAPDYAAAYAVAWLRCPADVADAKLYVGSDDYIKVWINGTLVHTYKERRRASNQDQDVVGGIRLRRGLNRVVVKCVDVVYDWDFYFRLTDAKDRPIVVKTPPKVAVQE